MNYHKRNKLIHGYQCRKHPLYNTWVNLRDRCYNPDSDQYRDYGGRGIKVCRKWRESFERFALDMGLKPHKKLTLERINNNKGYKPSNCEWVTRKENNNNKRIYKTNTTGVSGISFSDTKGRFTVRKQINGVRTYLGETYTLEEAVAVWKSGLKKKKNTGRTKRDEKTGRYRS